MLRVLQWLIRVEWPVRLFSPLLANVPWGTYVPSCPTCL
jgi:hypothetical protein